MGDVCTGREVCFTGGDYCSEMGSNGKNIISKEIDGTKAELIKEDKMRVFVSMFGNHKAVVTFTGKWAFICVDGKEVHKVRSFKLENARMIMDFLEEHSKEKNKWRLA